MNYLEKISTILLVVTLLNLVHAGPINPEEPAIVPLPTEEIVVVEKDYVETESGTESIKIEDLIRPVSEKCPSGQIWENERCQTSSPIVEESKTPLKLTMSIPRN